MDAGKEGTVSYPGRDESNSVSGRKENAGAAAYYTAQGITPAGPETGASPEQEAAA